jgi:hypothetical protein
MTGLLSSLLVDETGWLTHSAVALTATLLLLGWWLGVILLSLRARDDAEGSQPSRR